MGAGFSYQGATGKLYHFALIDTERPLTLPWQGAVVVFAPYAPEPRKIVGTENLAGYIFNIKRVLVDKGTPAYALISDDAREREQIVRDLLGNYPEAHD